MDRLSFLQPMLTWESTRVVRRRRYFLFRTLYGMILAGLFTLVYIAVFLSAATQETGIAAFGLFAEFFFGGMVFLQLALVMVLTPAYVAHAVSAARRNQLFDQLMLTGRPIWQLLVGMWLGRVGCVLLLLLAGLPLVATSVFFGPTFFRSMLVVTGIAIVAVFSASALAVLAAAGSRNVRSAIVAAYAFLAAFLSLPASWSFGTDLILDIARRCGASRAVVTAWRGDCDTIAEYLLIAQPYDYYVRALGPNPIADDGGWRLIWLIFVHGASAMFCLALAVWVVSTESSRAARAAVRKQSVVRTWARKWRVPPVSAQPMIWKEWFFDHRPRRRWLAYVSPAIYAACSCLPVVFFLWTAAGTTSLSVVEINEMWRSITVLVVLIAVVLATIRAASSIGIEREDECWSTILATPLSAYDILLGKSVGAMKPIIWLPVLLLPTWLIGTYLGAVSPLALPTLMVIIGSFGFFAVAVATKLSLEHRKTGSAVVGSILVVIGLALGVHAIILAPGLVALIATLIGAGLEASSIPKIVSLMSPLYLVFQSVFLPSAVALTIESFVRATMAFANVAMFLICGLVILRRSALRFSDYEGRSDDGSLRPLTGAEIRGLAHAATISTRNHQPGFSSKSIVPIASMSLS